MGYFTDQKYSDQYYNQEDNQKDNQKDNQEDNQKDNIVNINNNLNDNNKMLQRQNVCYYTNILGQYICDAITNAKYPWKLGSFDERRFFKVTNSTGNLYNNKSNFAFYESPYAYMNHQNIQLDDDIIKNWYKKVNKLYPK